MVARGEGGCGTDVGGVLVRAATESLAEALRLGGPGRPGEGVPALHVGARSAGPGCIDSGPWLDTAGAVAPGTGTFLARGQGQIRVTAGASPSHGCLSPFALM
jgi:hypothetical protein